ncbi:unnamed protein product [Didymodactylos carnosus]|uniref:Rhodanese domain-containing protein n=1 Tax=Didymodactylos carnosus TaxID=1234261 RepID=A0A815JLN4_9BILA|nr:unnamed protein product [Didymodactylos carnosus]CAF1383752.1 unnamed protein product [Didymodactylos carnosus]CAF4090054.1 unnamed protein product [Didymodactylos carnosus]CAF4278801.1 unnamed protein product [Didymodactylos carnosus]
MYSDQPSINPKFDDSDQYELVAVATRKLVIKAPKSIDIENVYSANSTLKFDEIIDVRTPGEYEVDHLPNAVNLPVLTNEQRHFVGIKYNQNKFEGKHHGAMLITKNISNILEYQLFNDSNEQQLPSTKKKYLIYCQRGGQRSISLAFILTQIGYEEIFILQNGYSSYRKYVQKMISELSKQLKWRIIGTLTGCGKTDLLNYMEQHCQIQTLDLGNRRNSQRSV